MVAVLIGLVVFVSIVAFDAWLLNTDWFWR